MKASLFVSSLLASSAAAYKATTTASTLFISHPAQQHLANWNLALLRWAGGCLWLRRCEWRCRFLLAGKISRHQASYYYSVSIFVSNPHPIGSLASATGFTQLPAPKLSTTRPVLRGVARDAVNATT